jgi:hypothetical protein
MPSDKSESHPALVRWRKQIEMLEMWDRLGVLTAKGQDVLAYLRREVADFDSD